MEEGPDEGSEERQDPDDEEAQEAIRRSEGYQTEGGKYVIFDSKNPLAWILSTLYGYPADADRGAGEDEEEGPAE